MSFGLKDTGEELVLRETLGGEAIFPAQMTVGLYQDRDWYVLDTVRYDNINNREDTNMGDIHEDADDLGAIETEPAGASYARQSVAVGSGFTLGDPGDWRATMDDTTFDVSDSTQTVNAIFAGATWQSQDTNDSAANEHIVFTLRLQNERDLSLEDGDLTFTRGALSID